MKRFLLNDGENMYTLYVGTAQEVKAVYRSMYKAWNRNVTNFYNAFCGFPKFNDEKCYGLLINDTEMHFHVISSDTALRMIADI